ncbi:hypothetical protein [Saccharothrix sp. ALI-22-I]|uniref:hypothetical protein n=1 Tax=Saccharothrix sp. ALI-22-I TaxID=1933778 RepID=UPI0015C33311|nr:hypothetical protein [Saccharothrix sp. ALI-22-I]
MTANGSLGPEGEDLLVVRRGEGPYVEDTDGRRYIAGLSGCIPRRLVDLIARRLRQAGLLAASTTVPRR